MALVATTLVILQPLHQSHPILARVGSFAGAPLLWMEKKENLVVPMVLKGLAKQKKRQSKIVGNMAVNDVSY